MLLCPVNLGFFTSVSFLVDMYLYFGYFFAREMNPRVCLANFGTAGCFIWCIAGLRIYA